MAKKKTAEKTYFNIGEDWEVVNARRLDFGTFFTLQLPGLSLYDLRVVPAGKTYDAFIGMPERKGKDDNYYKVFNLFLTDEDTEAIIEEVEKALKKGKK